MRNVVVLVVVVSTIAFGDVFPGTLHRSDAQAVVEYMEECGIYSGRVKIVEFECLIIYAIQFKGNHFSWDSESDIAEISAFFLAVANVSALTSWHSDAAIALYEDDTVGMLTANCREVLRILENGNGLTTFLSNNVITGNRATSQLRLSETIVKK